MSADVPLIAAFSEDQAERLTGVTRGQLRYWDNSGFFKPSFADGGWGNSFGRIYTFRDVAALRVLNALRNQYSVSLQHLRDVKSRLVGAGIESWTGVKLYVFDRTVLWVEPGTDLPQQAATGQYLMPIDLGAVISDTKIQVQNLIKRDDRKVGRIERNRQVRNNQPVVAGTRITVQAIKRFRDAGYSVAGILQEYPDLTEQDVAAALSYQQAA